MADEYLNVNRANWDERAPAHAASPDYELARFIEDPRFISKVVQFDLPRLGSIAGLAGLHLQCHIGTDTISLARLGARMTGLDFSPESLQQARRLAELASTPVRFVAADVYNALTVLEPESFDLVYTGIGALCWLPDIDRWARTVAGCLCPGGRLFIRDMHPMLGVLEERDGEIILDGPYFERPEPMICDEDGTYVATDQVFETTITHEWNHGLGQIVTALLDAGLQLTGLVEHDSVPWQALPTVMTPAAIAGEWQLTDRPWRLAASFTLQAVRPMV